MEWEGTDIKEQFVSTAGLEQKRNTHSRGAKEGKRGTAT